MGVPGLWEILEPAAETTTMIDFLAAGFNKPSRPGKGWIVGIDASSWFFQAHHPFRTNHWRAGQNGELRVLYYRLASLASLPVTPLFVFDGAQRPACKRGKKTAGPEHWMADPLRKFIDAFGFDSHIAPGEAEAELALLNKAGLIDAVFTEDVDALIFGARTVVRGASIRTSQATISVFRAAEVSQHADVHLSASGLIMMALLCGGDYSMGCGPSLAHELSKTTLGDDLLDAAAGSFGITNNDITHFLRDWRQALRRQLSDNPDGYLTRKHRKLSRSIPNPFPDIALLRLYVSPLTSTLPFPSDSPLLSLGTRRLNIKILAAQCKMYFGQEQSCRIQEQLQSSLWPGELSRTLQEATSDHDVSGSAVLDAKLSACGLRPLKIQRQRSIKSTGYLDELQINIRTTDFANAGMPQPSTSRHASHSGLNPPPPTHVWLPLIVVEAFDPQAVAVFLGRPSRPKRIAKRKKSPSETPPLVRPTKKTRSTSTSHDNGSTALENEIIDLTMD
ncbi:PIN domain-like protein [Rickenella mellea]|uniref:PIN domain-like protein n=1 Tax=Rickenella mellea TaxID=50990 RepID=A0A4Y7Q9M7_9AGAM|nr:PIN domain-like protein [Rickenella mellea]